MNNNENINTFIYEIKDNILELEDLILEIKEILTMTFIIDSKSYFKEKLLYLEAETKEVIDIMNNNIIPNIETSL